MSAGNRKSPFPTFSFPLNMFWRVFDFALSLLFFIRQLVLCEAEWHPKGEEKDDYRRRVSACPRWVVYNPDYPALLPNEKGQSSQHPCEMCAVCLHAYVGLFQSHSRSPKIRVQGGRKVLE